MIYYHHQYNINKVHCLKLVKQIFTAQLMLLKAMYTIVNVL